MVHKIKYKILYLFYYLTYTLCYYIHNEYKKIFYTGPGLSMGIGVVGGGEEKSSLQISHLNIDM